jgi:hypothetical protein
MIKIKPHFHDWKEVDKNTAKSYISYLFENITGMNEKEKIKYINGKKLQGTTFDKLMQD